MSTSARMFALSTFAFAVGLLLPMAVVLNIPEHAFAVEGPLMLAAIAPSDAVISTSTCSTPTFYSVSVPAASQYTPWSAALLVALEGKYLPTVTAKNLAPGIELKEATTTLAAGGAVLHSWSLAGAPTQIGTYAMTVTAQNDCGGATTVITLPVSGAVAVPGQTCPTGTTGNYPLCTPVVATTTAVFVPAAPSAPTAPTAATPSVAPALTTTTAVAAMSCAAIGQTLRQGNRGGDVIALQNFLISQGFLAPDSATGYFGAQTRAAVQQFQASRGIASAGSEDTNGFGLVGVRTRAAIAQGCGSSTGGNAATTVVPLTGLPQCPRVTVPACPGGNLISAGTDQNHCVLGYICRTTSNALCPAVATPSCPNNGTAYPTGYDSNGCATGYQCSQLVCPTVSQPSCGPGQHIVTAPDANGCATISYCVGGTSGSGSTNTNTSSTNTNTSPFSNFGSGSFDINALLQSLGFGSLLGGGATISPAVPVSQIPPQTQTAPVQGSYNDAVAAFNSYTYGYGNATLNKCTTTNGSVIYVARGFNSQKSITTTFPPGAVVGDGTCDVVSAWGPMTGGGGVLGQTFNGTDWGSSTGASGAASASGSSGSGNGSGDAAAASDAGAAAAAGTGDGF